MAAQPLAYTSNPATLLKEEIKLFFKLAFDWRNLGLLSLIWPIKANHPDDELALTWRNAWSIAVHGALFVLQSAFLLFVLFAPLFGLPAIIYLMAIVLSIQINKTICDSSLNGFGQQVYYSGAEHSTEEDSKISLIPAEEDLKGERWVFINGVAAGHHWTTSNLNLIASIFHRPVLGIHNKTYGIIFDLLECILQRTFGYPTLDIRTAYSTISTMLKQPEVTKLILIAHSQGCIEAAMVLGWLYATLPREQVAKMEIYTFGNAANHFSCPGSLNGGGVLKHVEHYVNTREFVARFGVIFFRGVSNIAANGPQAHPLDWWSWLSRTAAQPANSQTLRARFVGKMFMRDASGHQLNQHYLHEMFAVDDNSFVSSVADESNFDDDRDVSNGTATAATTGDLLRDRSRLWQYRGGHSPED